MHSDISHLANLFKGVRDVRDAMRQYCLHPNMLAPDIQDLITGFEQVYNKKIRRILIPGGETELVRGVYLPNGEGAVILLDAKMHDHWINYISTKEMCQLILKDPEYMTSDPGDLIEMMIYEETAPQDGDAPLDLVSDMWTKIAAHELLFPYEIRKDAREKVDAGQTTIFELSRQHGVPEHVIDWALSPSYMAVCAEAWARIS